MKKKQTKWMLMSALLAALLASGPHPAWAGAVQASAAAVEPLTAKIIEARAKLQEGWDYLECGDNENRTGHVSQAHS